MKDKILKFNESLESNKVWLLIDKEAHSYEAIVGVYSSFDKAMNSEIWKSYDEIPNENGEGEYLSIMEWEVQ